MALLEVEDLRVSFGTDDGVVQAVRGVSFEIDRGQTLGIVGESGSGKSVATQTVTGLTRGARIRGSARFDGTDLLGATEPELRAIRGARIGMIFQDPLTSLHPLYRVGWQIVELIRAHQSGTSRQAARRRAAELLDLVGIPHATQRIDDYPHQFSGGMRQRVMIAMAMALNPDLLIADEPTTALDVTVQAQILAVMRQVQEEFGTAIILITHDLGRGGGDGRRGRRHVRRPGDGAGAASRDLLPAPPPLHRGPVRVAARPGGEGTVDGHPGTAAEPDPAAHGLSVPPTLRAGVHSVHGPGAAARPRPRRPGAPLGLLAAARRHRPRARRRGPRHRDPGSGVMTAVADAAPLLSAQDVTKTFPVGGAWGGRGAGSVRAVAGVTLDVMPGETLGLVGETGCGKSTLARCLTRLYPLTSGRVVFDGRDISTLSRRRLRPVRRQVQVIFQDPYGSLNPRRRVGSIIGDGLAIHGIDDGPGRRRRVQELMERVGLNPEHYNRFPADFSGGQRQRIGVARALAVRPKLIVCDEPVSALDVSIQAQVINLLVDLQAEFGLTYLFITHDLSVVRHVSRRIAVMYLGRIVELAPTEELFAGARHPYTRALLSALPPADPDAADSRERVVLTGDLPSPVDPPSGCPFHPRCPRARLDCVDREPVLEPVLGDAADHPTACHHPLDFGEDLGTGGPALAGAADAPAATDPRG